TFAGAFSNDLVGKVKAIQLFTVENKTHLGGN
ncbi:hypothetical protein L914_13934, partial [Phytophthora nicotianae]